jgi:putative regulator of septum formation
MSTSAAWFRSSSRTLSTRLVMAGAFVGALLVLGLSVVFSWPVKVSTGAASDDPAANFAAAFDAPTGSCLNWRPDGTDMRKVSCDVPHLFEVTGDVDISAEHGANAPSPTVEAWREIAKQKCTTGATEYLGGKLDPFGKFSVGALKPSDEQWKSGDRKLRCGLQRAGPAGKVLVPTTGPATKQDQSDVYDAGTCLALTDKTVGDPTDCVNAHAYEIVAVIDLAETFKDGVFPAEDKQQNSLADLCGKASAEYTGGVNLAEKKLSLTWDTRKQESWNAGSHKAQCKVGSSLPDGSGLAPVSGSIKKAPDTPAPPTTSSTPGG